MNCRLDAEKLGERQPCAPCISRRHAKRFKPGCAWSEQSFISYLAALTPTGRRYSRADAIAHAQGHQFLLHTLRSAAADTGADGSIPPGAPATSNKRIFPLRIYLCSRTPPPQGQKTLDGLLEANRGEDQIRGTCPLVDCEGSYFDPTQTSCLEIAELSDSSLVHCNFPMFLAAIADEVYHIPLDLASPSSIRSCAAAFDRMETARRGHVDAAERDRATTTTSVGSRLDYLVLNAAIAPGSERRTLPVSRGMEASEEDAQATKEIEESFAVNVLGNALLWQELEPFLSPSEGPSSGQLETSKVVVVSSELHRRCHRGELGLSGDKNAAIVPEDLAVVMGAERWKGMNAYKVGKLVQ